MVCSLPGTEEIISNLDDPWIAEQFRIRKIVEDKFIKLEHEIKEEYDEMSNKTQERLQLITIKNDSKAETKRILHNSISSVKRKSEDRQIQVQDSRSMKEKEQSDNPLVNINLPSLLTQQEYSMNVDEITVDDGSFLRLSPPKLIRKNILPNIGVFEFHHKHARKRKEESRLTSHLIPGVNIKPELTIQWIPELSIPAVLRNSDDNNQLVNKLHTIEPNMDNDESFYSQITKSTTSKFEEVEMLFERNKCGDIDDIKKHLRARVKEILIKKYNLDVDEFKQLKSLSYDSDFILQSSESIRKNIDPPQNENSPTDDDYSSYFENMTNNISSKEELYENPNQDLEKSFQEEENDYKYDAGYAEYIAPQKQKLSTIIEVSSTTQSNLSAPCEFSQVVKSNEDEKNNITEDTCISCEPTDDDTVAPSIKTDSSINNSLMPQRNQLPLQISEESLSKVEPSFEEEKEESHSKNFMDPKTEIVSVTKKSKNADICTKHTSINEVMVLDTKKTDMITDIIEKDILDKIFHTIKNAVEKSETAIIDIETQGVSVRSLNSSSESNFIVESAIGDSSKMLNNCMPISKYEQNISPINEKNVRCVIEGEMNNEEQIPQQITVSSEQMVKIDHSELNRSEIVSLVSSVPPSSSSGGAIPLPLSSGEIMPEVNACLQSKGEICCSREQQEDSRASKRNDISDGENFEISSMSEVIEKSLSILSVEERMDHIVSSLSSGEWNANPEKLQRLARFADSFGLYK